MSVVVVAVHLGQLRPMPGMLGLVKIFFEFSPEQKT